MVSIPWYIVYTLFQERIEKVEIGVEAQEHEYNPDQPIKQPQNHQIEHLQQQSIEYLKHQPIKYPQQQPIEHVQHPPIEHIQNQPIEHSQLTITSLANWKSSTYKSFVSLAEFVAARGTSCLAFLIIVTLTIGLYIDTQSMYLVEMRLALLIPLLWIRQSSELTDYVLKNSTKIYQYILDLV